MARVPSYGYFPGGDPREFHPDREVCTADELAAHKAACEAWDANDAAGVTTVPLASSTVVEVHDGGFTRYHRASFGLGVRFYEDGEPDTRTELRLVGDEVKP